MGRRFDEAVPKLLLSIQEDPTHPAPYLYLAACYAHMGRVGDAKDVIARMRGNASAVSHDVSYLRTPEHRELFLSGVRLAMGEAA